MIYGVVCNQSCSRGAACRSARCYAPASGLSDDQRLQQATSLYITTKLHLLCPSGICTKVCTNNRSGEITARADATLTMRHDRRRMFGPDIVNALLALI